MDVGEATSILKCSYDQMHGIKIFKNWFFIIIHIEY